MRVSYLSALEIESKFLLRDFTRGDGSDQRRHTDNWQRELHDGLFSFFLSEMP
jgi:hypothetical protein